VADAEKTLGQFNGLIQGKTVVMIDEAIAEKINVERLKRTVGNRTVDVNPKYGKQGEHDNTAMYLAGGNDNSGPILLAGDATDRRWSIIKVEKSIIQRLADDRKCSFDEALEFYKLMEHVYTDKDEVAKWLNYLIEKWQHLEMPPSGLHKEAYQELRSVQKTAFEELMELVFVYDKEFQHISGPDLFDLYKAFSAETNPAARGVMQRNKFYSQARTWVERNTQGIAWGQLKIRTPGAHVVTTSNGFHKVNSGKTFTGNHEKYIVEEKETPFWVAVTQEDMLLMIPGRKEVESTSEPVGIPMTDELLLKVSSGEIADIFPEQNVS
jgi:hypothetical protein